MDRDVLDLIEKRQIPVYVVAEDLAERGIERSELVPGVQLLSRTALPGLFNEYALVAHW
jgi:sulfur relay (sulfurtransferase) DsrF/TusC family protein